MDTATKMKRTLIGLKGHLTRQINKCQNLSQQSTVDYFELEDLLQVAESKFAHIKQHMNLYLTELHSTSVESSELEEVIDELAQYEEDIRVKLLPFKKQIAKNKLTVASAARTDPEVKLPQINIPTFSGDENESWDDFWNSLQTFRLELESLLKALSLKVLVQTAEWMTKVVVKRKLPRETLDKLCTMYNKTFLTLKEITEGLHTLVERQRANQDGEKVSNSSTNSHRNSTQVDTSVKPKMTLNKSSKFTSRTTPSTGKKSGNPLPNKMDTATKMKRTLIGLKGHLTRQINKCQNLSQQSTVDYFELEDLLQVAEKLHSTSVESSELEEVIDELAQYEEDIRVKLLPFKKQIAKNKLTVASAARTDPEVKLPQINIPTFSGDENESWDDFWNSLQTFRLELESLLKALSLKVLVQSAEWMTKVVVKRKLPRETLDKLCTMYNKTFLTLKEITEGLHTLVERQRANQDGEKVSNSSTNSHRNSTQVDTSVKPKMTLNKSSKFTSRTTPSTGKRSGNPLPNKMDTTTKMKRTLIGLKGHLTRQINKCQNLSQQSTVDYFELEDLLQVAEKLHSTSVESSELEEVIDELAQYEEDIRVKLLPFKKQIAKNKLTVASAARTDPEVKLPQINIPTFSGDENESWDDFWNSLQTFRLELESLLKALSLKVLVQSAEWMTKVVVKRKLPRETLDKLCTMYNKTFLTLKEITEGLHTLVERQRANQDGEKVSNSSTNSHRNSTQVDTSVKPKMTLNKSSKFTSRTTPSTGKRSGNPLPNKMDTATKMKRTLIGLKGHLTRQINKCQNLSQQSTVDYFELEDLLQVAEKLHSTSVESSELEEVIDELAQYEEDIRVKLLPFKKQIAKNKLTVASAARTDPEVKLPQINIPTFSGDENESWDDFWNSLQTFRLELESLLKALSLKVLVQSAEWMTKVVVKRKLPRETLDKLCTMYNKTFLTLKKITEGLHTLVERQRANQDGEKVSNSSTNSHRNSTQVDTSVKPKMTLNKSSKFTSRTTPSTGKRSGNPPPGASIWDLHLGPPPRASTWGLHLGLHLGPPFGTTWDPIPPGPPLGPQPGAST
ncbi:uncharacterized protein [Procambarus clarkii]|uniref:uncharacterized protein n=1 Tax=Procambarus clarkii TaxID=6728 RepID=UPI003742A483